MNTAPAFQLPYRRWFLWLLADCLLTLALPYFNRGDGWFYSPAIQTATQDASGHFVATYQHIWIDSHTAASINGDSWLYLGLLAILFEVTWLMVRHVLASYAARRSPLARTA